LRPIRVSGTDTVAPIGGIHTNALRPAKEILLKVGAGREHQNQSQDDPVKHGVRHTGFILPDISLPRLGEHRARIG